MIRIRHSVVIACGLLCAAASSFAQSASYTETFDSLANNANFTAGFNPYADPSGLFNTSWTVVNAAPGDPIASQFTGTDDFLVLDNSNEAVTFQFHLNQTSNVTLSFFLTGDKNNSAVNYVSSANFITAPVTPTTVSVGLNPANVLANPGSGVGALQTFTGTGLVAGDYFFTMSAANSGSNVGLDDVTFAAEIPEPETYAMFLAGLGALSFFARKRKAK